MIKSSCFNVPFSDGDTYAVWNSLSDYIAELSEREYLALLHNRLDWIYVSRQRFFQEKGILVDEPDEMSRFLEKRYVNRQMRSLYFRILTTTACNARCDYCYEHNFPVLSMDGNIAVSVAEFITNQYKAHPLRAKVNIEWFGGEPCMNPNAIQVITERLINENIPFRAQMTTNGILLTESLLSNASDWNLRQIQITLDAAGEEYEEIKHVSEGSYDQVLLNIDLCLSSDVRVVVRINYAGNKKQIEALIDSLSSRYSGKSNKPKVYISTVYSDGKCISAVRMGEVMDLNERLIKTNLMAFEEVYGVQQRDRCFSSTPWGYTIMPNGMLVNCSHNVSAENSWGTIWDADSSKKLHQLFLSDKLSDECYMCPLIPVCGGGCPAAQHGVASLNQCIPYKSIILDILRKRFMRDKEQERINNNAISK